MILAWHGRQKFLHLKSDMVERNGANAYFSTCTNKISNASMRPLKKSEKYFKTIFFFKNNLNFFLPRNSFKKIKKNILGLKTSSKIFWNFY